MRRGGVELRSASGYYSDPFAFSLDDACYDVIGLEGLERDRYDSRLGASEKIAPTLFEK
jgi:hypothetical protein